MKEGAEDDSCLSNGNAAGSYCSGRLSGVETRQQLIYGVSKASYFRNVPITPDVPTSQGGAVSAYLVSPALPAGLNLDLGTGVIAGTPTQVSGATPYQVTALNTAGSAVAVLTLDVTDSPQAPFNLSYRDPTPVYVKGRSIPPNSPHLSAGTATHYAVQPALEGLVFDAATGVISGTPSGPGASPYTVTAINAGGSATTQISLTVTDVRYPSTTIQFGYPGTSVDFEPLARPHATSFSISPSALPARLQFNTASGIISGTPTVSSAAWIGVRPLDNRYFSLDSARRKTGGAVGGSD